MSSTAAVGSTGGTTALGVGAAGLVDVGCWVCTYAGWRWEGGGEGCEGEGEEGKGEFHDGDGGGDDDEEGVCLRRGFV